MPIASSTFTLGPAQSDGRRWCVERHTDHAGVVRVVEYLAAVGTDNTAVMNARAVQLAAALKEAELQYAITTAPWDYTLGWATLAELAATVREQYKTASKADLAALAARILEWIANGRFTDVQVRNAFGLNASQWTTLKNKMTTLVTNQQAINSATGE